MYSHDGVISSIICDNRDCTKAWMQCMTWWLLGEGCLECVRFTCQGVCTADHPSADKSGDVILGGSVMYLSG